MLEMREAQKIEAKLRFKLTPATYEPEKNSFCVSLDDVEYNTVTFHFQDTMKELSHIM